MIDIKRYIEKKEKGLVIVVKMGNVFALSQKKFDAETGEELEPEVVGFNLKELEEIKKALQKTTADLDILIADAKAL